MGRVKNNAETRAVIKLHNRLAPISMAQINWICGQHRHTTQKAYAETKRKVSCYDYYTIITTCKEWQVIRRFLIHAEQTRRGYKFCYLNEVSQRWLRIDEKGEMQLHIFEKQKSFSWYYKSQPFCLGAPLSLKGWNMNYDRGGRTYFSMNDEEIYPRRQFTQCIVEHNIDRLLGRCDEIQICRHYKGNTLEEQLSQCPSVKLDKSNVVPIKKGANYLPVKFETLYKIGERYLAQEYINGGWWDSYRIDKYWRQMLIARKHSGIKCRTLAEWSLFYDYVDDLERLHLDTHSPHYLCPKEGIENAHAKLVDRITREREKLAREREQARYLEELKEWDSFDEKYVKNMGKYLTLRIHATNLNIQPLQCVQEFYDEGKAMHHCVYTNGYYKRAKSLILSARNDEGERIETIEVNLYDYSITQSRGVCNKATDRHDEIVKLVKENMNMIRAIA